MKVAYYLMHGFLSLYIIFKMVMAYLPYLNKTLVYYIQGLA